MASQHQPQQQSPLPPPPAPPVVATAPSPPTAAAAAATAQHRPPFAHPTPPFRAEAGARASPMNSQSPGMLFSSPSPQFGQPPAAKRPRLSSDAGSPFHLHGQAQTNAAVPVNGALAPPGPGSMPPPQRPAERERADRFENDVMRMSGIDLEQESQNLTAHTMYPAPSFHSRPSAAGRPNAAGNQLGTAPGPGGSAAEQQVNGSGAQAEPIPEPTPEERQARLEARADWEASRHRQFPLWDMFLYGGPLNDRIREKSQQERLHDPQAGVLVNTQRTGPPPRARVNGFEGATREIDKGQAILDSGAKGERLREIMSIISLATKTRLTGMLNASTRLASERRQHSKGQPPAEWADLAVARPAPAASTAVKRTHSQANEEPAAKATAKATAAAAAAAAASTDTIATTFQKLAQAERAEEEARRAKRAKRKNGTSGAGADTPGTPDVAAMEAAVAAESSQKMSKKAQKEIAGRAAEQVAHASANEAARLAISGMMGSRFGGKKNRTYDWLTAGKSGSSTPTRVASSAPGSLAGTPSAPRTQAKDRDSRSRAQPWDEDKEPGIQARDVLLVLESDARAPKTYLKAVEKIKD